MGVNRTCRPIQSLLRVGVVVSLLLFSQLISAQVAIYYQDIKELGYKNPAKALQLIAEEEKKLSNLTITSEAFIKSFQSQEASAIKIMWLFFRKADILYILGRYDQLQAEVSQLQARHIGLSSPLLRAHLYFTKGLSAQSQSRFRTALENYEKVTALSSEYNFPELSIQARIQISNVYILTEEYHESIPFSHQAFTDAQAIGSQFLIARANEMLGIIYTDLKEYDKAIEYYEQAAEIFENLGYTFYSSSCLYGIATAYRYAENWNLAIVYFDRFFEEESNKNDFYGHYGLSMTLSTMGACDRALKEITKTLTITGPIDYKAELYKKQSLCFVQQENIQRAELAYQDAKNIFDKLPELEGTNWTLELVKIQSEIERLKGNHEVALNLYKDYHQKFTRLQNEISSNHLNKATIKLENQRKDVEIDLLTAQKNRQFQTYFIAITALLFLSFFVFYRSRQIRLRQVAKRDKLLVIEKDKALRATESSLKLKNEFITAISHELRTPLGEIIGGIDLFKSDKEKFHSMPAKLKATYSIIENASENLLQLVDDILVYTEIQQNKLCVIKARLELEPFLNAIYQKYAIICQTKGLEFNWTVAQDLPSTIGIDENKLSLVLKKLLDNAVEFTDRGSITFELARKFDAAEPALELSIKDTGIGIEQKDQKKIFAPFTQSEGGFQRAHSGLGVGLTICRSLVNLMGGELSFHSEEGQGTQFTVTLPYNNCKIEEKAPDSNKQSNDSPLLIVEDNIVNQTILVNMLKKLGLKSNTAENGEEALKKLGEKSYSVVLMDLQMPIMDGFTCSKEIRKSSSTIKDIPIIAVTANTTDSDRQDCQESGMNDFMSKPVTQDALRSKLSKYVRLSS